MRTISLKIDADTLRGTREGVPRLAALLTRLDIPATFLFSLGPDHTGRALRRVFRRGFLGKLRRTSVVSNYGLKTLLYGTLLPGPRIGLRCRSQMREVMHQGFDIGVHAYDHVKWQDGVVGASMDWTREQLRLACDVFWNVFECAPRVHGAAGWQINAQVPALEAELGFRFASDTRGRSPFIPASGGVPQLPTTLPTLDELIGRVSGGSRGAIDSLAESTVNEPSSGHVFTLHAELEGGAYLAEFETLLRRWRGQGYRFISLSTLFDTIDVSTLGRCDIVSGPMPGRAGELALQCQP
ncbi:MAG: chitin deacetylase [Steroidobacteraceae bacterium]|nr:chitin deacetylase [Steroidobacteraceae bacterium]MBM2854166.1 chitin deacetylase [Steroidobacteraceae bacterium]